MLAEPADALAEPTLEHGRPMLPPWRRAVQPLSHSLVAEAEAATLHAHLWPAIDSADPSRRTN